MFLYWGDKYSVDIVNNYIQLLAFIENREMTDIELDIFYRAIKSIEELRHQLDKGKDVVLNEEVTLRHLENGIELIIKENAYKVEMNFLDSIFEELKQQTSQAKMNEIASNRYDERRDLKKVDKNKFYAHKEFLLDMIYARDVASGQSEYKRKLGEIVKLFRNGNCLATDTKTYFNINEFVDDYLKSQYGFTSLEDEQRRK
ncbi:MAG TPA: hypothetical protein PKL31_14380 [Fulvivirga sp.]|nr:hypothetical protein [Fulvivirga sp.]